MATTTPNYGWAVPTSTDLVKDGATAIETLGDAIDASMNTALGTKKAGMVLLNTTSFSGVASQSVSDVFSATYDNYRIVVNYTNSTATVTNMRLRVSGADNTTTNYTNAYYYLLSNRTAAATGNVHQAATTFWGLTLDANTTSGNAIMDLYQPFATAITRFNATGFYSGYSPRQDYAMFAGGVFDPTTSFTGLTIFPNAGTITGSISVFGVNK